MIQWNGFPRYLAAMILVVMSNRTCTVAAEGPAPPRIFQLQEIDAVAIANKFLACDLKVRSASLRAEQPPELHVRFELREQTWFYNANFAADVDPPAVAAVFDERGRYLGDLLRPPGSKPRPTARPTTFPHLVLLSAEVRGISPLKALDPDLKPGKYAVQFIFDGRNSLPPKEMIDRWTPLSTEQLERWRTEAKPDVFRSNVVRIEVVAD